MQRTSAPTWRWLTTVILVAAGVALATTPAGATVLHLLQDDSVATGAEAPDSPRATMRQFLTFARDGDFERAAGYLDFGARPERPRIAERLYRVIERRVAINLDSISPLPQGDPADGELALHDRVGRLFVDGRPSSVQPIVLRRTSSGGEERWVILERTLRELGTAWTGADTSWTTGRLPPALLRPGPLGLARWQWAGFVVVPLLAWIVTLAIAFVLRNVVLLVARRTRSSWDDELITRLRGPLRLLIASILLVPMAPLLELDADTIELARRVLRGVTVVAVFWAMLRLIGLAQDHIARQAWLSDHATGRTIVPLVGRSLRILLGLVALLVALSQFGYPVGTVLAGLGIGGIAVALAAQKTVENVFGSVSIAADRVFRVGDWVGIEDVQGSVERIGLRSTLLRTADRTLVKYPNGKLAELRVENFGDRDRIRFFTTLSLVRETTAAQMRTVLQDVDAILRAHPRVWPEGIAVRLVAIGEYGLDVNVNAWLQTTNAMEFDAMREELLLDILDAIERAGTRLALPVQVAKVQPADFAGPRADGR